jgi:hypothetical protein
MFITISCNGNLNNVGCGWDIIGWNGCLDSLGFDWGFARPLGMWNWSTFLQMQHLTTFPSMET